MISSLRFRGPVTALDQAVYHNKQFIFWGNGTEIQIENISAKKGESENLSLTLFNAAVIQGISCWPKFDRVTVFGECNLCILLYSNAEPLTDDSTASGDTTTININRINAVFHEEHLLTGLDDWILDCALLSCTPSGLSVAVGYAHSMIDILMFGTAAVPGYTRLYRTICPEVSVLFSLSFSPSPSELLIANGTVFGKLILWSPSPSPSTPTPISPIIDSKVTATELTSIPTCTPTVPSTCRNSKGCLIGGAKIHEGVIFKLKWLENRTKILSVSDDRTVRLHSVALVPCSTSSTSGAGYYDSVSIEPIFVGWGHINRLWDAIYLPCDKYQMAGKEGGPIIVTASEDCSIKFWDLKGKCLNTLRGHNGDVWRLATCCDDKVLISSSQDGSVKMWDIPYVKETCPDSPWSALSRSTIPTASLLAANRASVSRLRDTASSTKTPSVASAVTASDAVHNKNQQRRLNGVCAVKCSPCAKWMVLVLIEGVIWAVRINDSDDDDDEEEYRDNADAEGSARQKGRESLGWVLLSNLQQAITAADVLFQEVSILNEHSSREQCCYHIHVSCALAGGENVYHSLTLYPTPQTQAAAETAEAEITSNTSSARKSKSRSSFVDSHSSSSCGAFYALTAVSKLSSRSDQDENDRDRGSSSSSTSGAGAGAAAEIAAMHDSEPRSTTNSNSTSGSNINSNGWYWSSFFHGSVQWRAHSPRTVNSWLLPTSDDTTLTSSSSTSPCSRTQKGTKISLVTAALQGWCSLWSISHNNSNIISDIGRLDPCDQGTSVVEVKEVVRCRTAGRHEIASCCCVSEDGISTTSRKRSDFNFIAVGDCKGGITLFLTISDRDRGGSHNRDCTGTSIKSEGEEGCIAPAATVVPVLSAAQYIRLAHGKEVVSCLVLCPHGFVSAGHDGFVNIYRTSILDVNSSRCGTTSRRRGTIIEWKLVNRLTCLPIATPGQILIVPDGDDKSSSGVDNGNHTSISAPSKVASINSNDRDRSSNNSNSSYCTTDNKKWRIYVSGFHGSEFIVRDLTAGSTEILRVEGGSWRRPHHSMLSMVTTKMGYSSDSDSDKNKKRDGCKCECETICVEGSSNVQKEEEEEEGGGRGGGVKRSITGETKSTSLQQQHQHHQHQGTPPLRVRSVPTSSLPSSSSSSQHYQQQWKAYPRVVFACVVPCDDAVSGVRGNELQFIAAQSSRLTLLASKLDNDDDDDASHTNSVLGANEKALMDSRFEPENLCIPSSTPSSHSGSENIVIPRHFGTPMHGRVCNCCIMLHSSSSSSPGGDVDEGMSSGLLSSTATNVGYVVVGCEDGHMKVLSAPELKLVQDTTMPNNVSLKVLATARSSSSSGRSNREVVVAAGGKLSYSIWNTTTCASNNTEQQPLPLGNVLAFSCSGSIFQNAGQDHRILAVSCTFIGCYAHTQNHFSSSSCSSADAAGAAEELLTVSFEESRFLVVFGDSRGVLTVAILKQYSYTGLKNDRGDDRSTGDDAAFRTAAAAAAEMGVPPHTDDVCWCPHSAGAASTTPIPGPLPQDSLTVVRECSTVGQVPVLCCALSVLPVVTSITTTSSSLSSSSVDSASSTSTSNAATAIASAVVITAGDSAGSTSLWLIDWSSLASINPAPTTVSATATAGATCTTTPIEMRELGRYTAHAMGTNAIATTVVPVTITNNNKSNDSKMVPDLIVEPIAAAAVKLVVCSGGDDQSLCCAEVLITQQQPHHEYTLFGLNIHKECGASGSAIKGVKFAKNSHQQSTQQTRDTAAGYASAISTLSSASEAHGPTTPHTPFNSHTTDVRGGDDGDGTVSLFAVTVGYDQRLSLWRRAVSLYVDSTFIISLASPALPQPTDNRIINDDSSSPRKLISFVESTSANEYNLGDALRQQYSSADPPSAPPGNSTSAALITGDSALEWVAGRYTAVSDVCGIDVLYEHVNHSSNRCAQPTSQSHTFSCTVTGNGVQVFSIDV